MKLDTKYGVVKIFAKTVENDALSQIIELCNSPLGENAHFRAMPDCHAGAGCTIGSTMIITNKVCPNLVGVDIGCGVDLVKTNLDFKDMLPRLDYVIKAKMPSGRNVHENQNIDISFFNRLLCWNSLNHDTKSTALRSKGTLGGGNHFIEAYEGGFIAVHSGSRNIGYRVADYYQTLAKKRQKELIRKLRNDLAQTIPPPQREEWLKKNKIKHNPDLAWLEGEDMDAYLHDLKIMQEFAVLNRQEMLSTIVDALGGNIIDKISSTHNYIDNDNILRKGAIRAYKNEIILIPLNMRDGMLICKGKGNADWNYSAPHGAGRLYSRSQAKKLFSVSDYAQSMKDIYTTCVSFDTLDEAPFAYKDAQEIMQAIEPTAEILEHIKPIYNFKASD